MNEINESRLSSFLYSIALNTSKEGAKQRTEKVFITLAERVERHVTTYVKFHRVAFCRVLDSLHTDVNVITKGLINGEAVSSVQSRSS